MNPKTTFFLTILLIALCLIGCDKKHSSALESNVNSTTAFDIGEMKMIIQEKTNRFTEAHVTKDTTFLNNCFSKEAKIFPPNSEAIIGETAISKLNSDWVNYGVYEFKETSTSLYGTKDYLIDEGTYYLRYGPENAIENGKYINIWKNENGEWKLFSNIWNSSDPL